MMSLRTVLSFKMSMVYINDLQCCPLALKLYLVCAVIFGFFITGGIALFEDWHLNVDGVCLVDTIL